MPNRKSPVHARISSDLSKSAKHDGLNGERSGFEPSVPVRSLCFGVGFLALAAGINTTDVELVRGDDDTDSLLG